MMLAASCSTYELSINTFKERFSDVEYSDFKEVEVRGPFGEIYNYKTHPSETIELIAKSGEIKNMTVKPSLEMRVTHSGGKKNYFYFDKVYLTENFLYGDRTRFSDSFQKKIQLDSIEKLEVQDGKKNFKYTKR